MTDQVSEIDDGERDEYDELLAALGRTEEEDQRIAIHEAAHAVACVLLGRADRLGGVTITPSASYQGLCWGERREAFNSRLDASDVRNLLQPTMPEPGENRASVSDVFSNVHAHCVEYVAGKVGEEMLAWRAFLRRFGRLSPSEGACGTVLPITGGG